MLIINLNEKYITITKTLLNVCNENFRACKVLLIICFPRTKCSLVVNVRSRRRRLMIADVSLTSVVQGDSSGPYSAHSSAEAIQNLAIRRTVPPFPVQEDAEDALCALAGALCKCGTSLQALGDFFWGCGDVITDYLSINPQLSSSSHTQQQPPTYGVLQADLDSHQPSRTAPWNPSVGHRALWSWVNSLERSQQHSDRRLTIGGSSQWIIGWLPVEWSITPVWKVKIAILHYSMDWFKGKFTGKPHI